LGEEFYTLEKLLEDWGITEWKKEVGRKKKRGRTKTLRPPNRVNLLTPHRRGDAAKNNFFAKTLREGYWCQRDESALAPGGGLKAEKELMRRTQGLGKEVWGA